MTRASVSHTLAGVKPSKAPDPDGQPSKFQDYAGEYLDKHNAGRLVFTTDGQHMFVSATDLEALGIGYEKQMACYVRDSCVFTVHQDGQTHDQSLTFMLGKDGKGEFARTRLFVATRVEAVDGGDADEAEEAGHSGAPGPAPMPASEARVRGYLARLKRQPRLPLIGLPDLP